MAQQIILRRGTSSEWTAVGTSLVLAAGEAGFETNTGKLKIGDGASVWNNLSYVSSSITELSQLSDVDVAEATIGQVLTWDGIVWSPTDIPDDDNTTYSLSADISASPNSASIKLTDDQLTVDEVTFSGAGGVTIFKSSGNSIIIESSEFDTDDSLLTGTTSVEELNASSSITSNLIFTDTISSSVSNIKIDTTNSILMRPTQGTTFGSGTENIDGKITQLFNRGSDSPLGLYPVQSIIQAHSAVNSNPVQWLRSRGTIVAPTAVVTNDNIGVLAFAGYTGSTYSLGAAISTIVESTPTTNHTPTKIRFSTNGGAGIATRAELTSIGVLKVSGMTSLNLNDDLQIVNNGTGRLRLPEGTTVGGVAIGTISIQGSVAEAADLPSIDNTTGFLYITEDDGNGHIWNGTAWVDIGAIKGPVGNNGNDGVDGDDGRTIFNGTVDPTIEGANGDFYINTASNEIFGPKAAGVWPAGVSLVGPAGNAGTDGAPGADGAAGVGVPVGGSEGQVLIKASGNDYDTEWGTASTVAALTDLTDVVITGAPTDGQVLKYDGTNWVNGTDLTSTIFTRQTVSGSTGTLADGARGPINITGYKSYALLKIQTSAAAWVRIYVSEAARVADEPRTEGEDPLPGAGIIAEVITTGAETVLITPGTIGFNNETIVTTNIPCRVTNKSGGDANITVTLTAIQLEA